jgi:hypothetical protein
LAAERESVLAVLNSERFAYMAPAAIHATLLDKGRYLSSIRTMDRLLAQAGRSLGRRRQGIHPAYVKPELLATRPNAVRSRDITKLMGPVYWSMYRCYVILDIFTRYVVGCIVVPRETAQLDEQRIADTLAKRQIAPGTLTLHVFHVRGGAADRSGYGSHPQPSACLGGPSVLRFAVPDAQVPARVPRPHRPDDISCFALWQS